MATLNNFTPGASIKALLCGDPGTGKTGSLASLVKAGYNLRIMDFDKGVAPLVGILKKEPNAAELLARVDSVPLGDPVKKGKPTQALAWIKAQDLLMGKDDWKDYGPIETWDSSTVLVVDSLSHNGRCIMNFVLHQAGRLGAKSGVKGGIEMSHWGSAMEEQEVFLATLYDDSIRCHVLVLAHISIKELEDGTVKGMPSGLGSKWPPRIGSYFNNLFTYRVIGSGPGLKRVISTKGSTLIAGKSESLDLPLELPIETGLATIFEIIKKGTP